MKYFFRDIWDESIYTKSNVLFITGPHSIFNNVAVDKVKEVCRAKSQIQYDPEILAAFGLVAADAEESTLNRIDISQYLTDSFTPSINGRWYCAVVWSALSTKQKGQVEEYIKNPSEHGSLVVEITDFKDYVKFLRDRNFTRKENVNLIQLSFPNRESLVKITQELFRQNDVTIDEAAAELFTFKMSDAYEEYVSVITQLAISIRGQHIDHKEMSLLTRGINRYVIDDFIREMVRVNSSKTKGNAKNSRNRIHKMASSIIYDIGARDFIFQLKRKVRDYLAFRLEINKGNLPVIIDYHIPDIKDRIGEENPLVKISDFKFKRMGYIASTTSLEDWLYIWLMLSKITVQSRESECERVIFSIIHRNTLTYSRLMNDIGVENILSQELYNINSTPYFEGLIINEGKEKELEGADIES